MDIIGRSKMLITSGLTKANDEAFTAPVQLPNAKPSLCSPERPFTLPKS